MFPIDTINLAESAVQINDDDDDDDHLPPTAKEIMRRKVDLDDEHDELEDRNINAATSQPYLFPLWIDKKTRTFNDFHFPFQWN